MTTELNPELQKAVNDVLEALSPLPEGYFVEGDEKQGSVLVYSKYPEPEGLGFAITARDIAEGDYADRARTQFTQLMKYVEAGGATADGPVTSH